MLLKPAATASRANLPKEVLFFAALVVDVDGEPMKTEVALEVASPKSSRSNPAINSALAASAAVALAISAAIAVASEEGIEDFHYEFVKDILSGFKVYDISDTDDLLTDVFEACYGISMSDIPEEWSVNIVKNTSNHKTAEKVEISDLSEDVRSAFFKRTHHDYLIYESCLNK